MSDDMRSIWVPFILLVIIVGGIGTLVVVDNVKRPKRPVHQTDSWCVEQGARTDFTSEEYRRYMDLCRS